MQMFFTCRDRWNTLAVMPGGALCYNPMPSHAAQVYKL